MSQDVRKKYFDFDYPCYPSNIGTHYFFCLCTKRLLKIYSFSCFSIWIPGLKFKLNEMKYTHQLQVSTSFHKFIWCFIVVWMYGNVYRLKKVQLYQEGIMSYLCENVMLETSLRLSDPLVWFKMMMLFMFLFIVIWNCRFTFFLASFLCSNYLNRGWHKSKPLEKFGNPRMVIEWNSPFLNRGWDKSNSRSFLVIV